MPPNAFKTALLRIAPHTTRRFAQWRMREWQCGSIRVSYRLRLDGGGRQFAPEYVEALRRRPESAGRRFRHAFEWCSGPGFIGFTLLAEGLCERLCLADINPEAAECVRRTVRRNGLGDRVTVYSSDNFRQIPAHEQFDLVVGNPPNYFALNPQHPAFAIYREDLRPNDRDWVVHRDFYANVRRHLQPGALLMIDEIDVFEALVIPSWSPSRIPYDIRPRPAIEDFRAMIAEAGLELLDVLHLCEAPGGFRVELLVMRNPGG
jgi:hypothetical protein